MTAPIRPTASAVETPLPVPPDAVALGRARGLPLRRESPDKLTGAARYTDDLITPGAWFGPPSAPRRPMRGSWAWSLTLRSTGPG